jgi:mono/diheme cytochrome c family protein
MWGAACTAEAGKAAAPTAKPVAAATSSAASMANAEADSIVDASRGVSGAATVAGTAPVTTDSVLLRGEGLFAKNCAICHGDSGDGAGKFAYLMNPRPRDLRQGSFKLSTTENQIPTDEDLLRTISTGMPGSAMPPWGHLPMADLEALVKYVRKLNIDGNREMLRGWTAKGILKESELPEALAQRTQPGPALMVPPEPAFDEIRWFRGRRLYLENCASCHGADGNPVADAVKFDAEGYPVPPRSFVNGIFKGSSQGHQLYARIWKGMKGTPMPASEGAYTADEVWDLIHYVQSLARSGAQERAQLKQGTFVAARVQGALPGGPDDPAWSRARPMYVGLTPLWWTEERIEGMVVQALHNGEELAIRMSWIDASQDDLAVRQNEFRDAVAIQFSLTSDPPFYMGSAGKEGGVNIWMWKADRERNVKTGHQDVDNAFPDRAVDLYPEQAMQPGELVAMEWPRAAIEKHDPLFITAWGAGNLVADPTMPTPVECLTARGPGTLAAKPVNVQLVQGEAVYERGVWSVQVRRTMELPHDHTGTNGGDERRFRTSASGRSWSSSKRGPRPWNEFRGRAEGRPWQQTNRERHEETS